MLEHGVYLYIWWNMAHMMKHGNTRWNMATHDGITSTNETLLGYQIACVKQCQQYAKWPKLNWYDWSEMHRGTKEQHCWIDPVAISQKIHDRCKHCWIDTIGQNMTEKIRSNRSDNAAAKGIAEKNDELSVRKGSRKDRIYASCCKTVTACRRPWKCPKNASTNIKLSNVETNEHLSRSE